ncbi:MULTISPECIES: acyltransferase [Flavobacterium]|uniref:Acyltransferase n=2 Tax=Flavobacterium TaxID=237 RepID=A0A2N9P714_9FLAO|nr:MULTISPECIES: acyltransferase [Flavobacterium]QYS89375.1 acyltransferase [Flavobacterium davisii]RVU90590.1 acyltransferase [Flavobacterium columnare]SPE76131.1 Acyltransferase family protein [Flavobacterium columnare]
MAKLPNLTSIRFLLASIVVVFHIPSFCKNRGLPYYDALPIFNKGTEAVYFFFSLSGFLIIRNVFIEKNKGTTHLKNFFLRRALRILPLYYLIFFIGLIFYHLIAPHFGFTHNPEYNIFLALTLGLTCFPNILAKYNPGGIIEILWSIGIEEQFYLFIAPVIYFLKPIKAFLFLTLFTIFYFYMFNFSSLSTLLNKYGMTFFYFSFSGIIAYLFIHSNRFKIPLFLTFISSIISLFIFLSNFFKTYLNNEIYQLLCMCSFSLTLYFLSQKPITFLQNKILVSLGEISYGIYMYHAITFQLIGYIFIKMKLHVLFTTFFSIILFNLSVFLLTISISYFSYHFYEKRFLTLKKQ